MLEGRGVSTKKLDTWMEYHMIQDTSTYYSDSHSISASIPVPSKNPNQQTRPPNKTKKPQSYNSESQETRKEKTGTF